MRSTNLFAKWSNLSMVVGIALLVFGLSGFRGANNNRFRPQSAHFPDDARVAMMLGGILLGFGWLVSRQRDAEGRALAEQLRLLDESRWVVKRACDFLSPKDRDHVWDNYNEAVEHWKIRLGTSQSSR